MNFLIPNPGTDESFLVSPVPTSRVENCWVQRQDGEGTEMNIEEMCRRIYKALNEYFEEVM